MNWLSLHRRLRDSIYSRPGSPSRSFLAGRDSTWRWVWRQRAVFNLLGPGLKGTAPPPMTSWWGRLVTLPSSCSVDLVFIHRRGKLWAALLGVQLPPALYTRKRQVLPLALCSASLSSSAHVGLRASLAHGLFSRGGESSGEGAESR